MTTQKRAVLAVYIISFVLLLQGVTGTTIAYIIQSYSDRVSPISVQQLMSLPAIFGLIISFIIGPIAMKINKKYLTMICALSIFTYFAFFALVGSKGPFSLLLISTVFAGIAQGSAMTLMSSMIGEFVGPAKSATYVAVGLALMNGGGALMAILGGAIAAGNGGANWPYTYYLGLLIVPAMLAFGFLMPKKPDAEQAAPQPAGGPGEAAPPPPRWERQAPRTGHRHRRSRHLLLGLYLRLPVLHLRVHRQ